MNANLNVILLNYRTPNFVVDCLASMEHEICCYQEGRVQVIVVDNNSGDGSCKIINEAIEKNGWNDWVRLVESSRNVGFAAGNNLGIRTCKADAYILLNSDTLVKPGLFAELTRAMRERPDAGLIAPSIVDQNGNPDVSAFRWIRPAGEFFRSSGIGLLTRLLPRYDVIYPVREEGSMAEPDWVGFACVLIRDEVIEQVGYLDEGFFMYFEDVDYCRRVRNAGWKILYWSSAKIVHFLGGSSGFTSSRGRRKRAPEYYYISRSRYFKKHFGQWGLLVANVAWMLGVPLAMLKEVVMSRNAGLRERETLDNWIGFFGRQDVEN